MEETLNIAIPVFRMTTENYENALRGLGAAPKIITKDCDPSGFDGLLIPGGDDVNPERFGQENCGSEGIDDLLDAMQFAVLDRFVKAGKPVFGICRGHQLINIYFGGDLIQDLGVKNACHRREKGSTEDRIHLVHASQGTFLERLYGSDFVTNSSHHQGVGRLGTGLTAAAVSEDGVKEALFHETFPIWSVQFHPERMCFAHKRADAVDGSRVLDFFLEKCVEMRAVS
ncbi:MAG: gamma-glutamyl-gamma-aminobutyrate hydrolase family protein [Lachnospiraceae bacterium]|nr:gamma-glutamyl-gamma-aminobutyrate hydrolase family protein [Lachnospiraceae bacterium]